MTRVPLAAALVGAAGLVPFAWGVAMLFLEAGTLPTFGFFPPDPSGGVVILESFGAVILGFMGGCLWGFASAPDRRPTLILLAASAVPALLAFLAIRPEPAIGCLRLAFGFVALQAIDVVFQRVGVTPDYWLTLRLPLTAGVIAALLTGALYG
ncbi:MAG TPA: DUF3429 domain-containing protein [Amaricoccus sp.]|uniref:DUF3429 domain-containing protein n=1 Tax=Amaricoccus sp. TaxID=1872485 RepID=UPI002B9B22FD|nr:DUF3429 domain-containing protein [Amaricoccus sp.]HMQ93787.1 DUF3429 domain-containing protein [Amaricoccus sp.]HMR53114.1 DUF3429 domain-containing protein [Amaricoccus sp.]HMR61010.1 DUF3429 domain-containing protein [Amaricoccus sp.]HMU00032.1 DUF3429 domain-containing protein [Amaricoccus sp.]